MPSNPSDKKLTNPEQEVSREMSSPQAKLSGIQAGKRLVAMSTESARIDRERQARQDSPSHTSTSARTQEQKIKDLLNQIDKNELETAYNYAESQNGNRNLSNKNREQWHEYTFHLTYLDAYTQNTSRFEKDAIDSHKYITQNLASSNESIKEHWGSLSFGVKAEKAQELQPGQTTSDTTTSQPISPRRIESQHLDSPTPLTWPDTPPSHDTGKAPTTSGQIDAWEHHPDTPLHSAHDTPHPTPLDMTPPTRLERIHTLVDALIGLFGTNARLDRTHPQLSKEFSASFGSNPLNIDDLTTAHDRVDELIPRDSRQNTNKNRNIKNKLTQTYCRV